MDKTLSFVEGTIPLTFNGESFYTYYKVVGNPPSSTSSSRPPVIAIHGGPGFSHDYILPISDIVVRDPSTTVIFYDLLGGARSTHLPHKPETFWTFELFIAELDNLVRHFGLQDKPFDLLGHCFGGALAMEYIVKHQPKALRRLVLVTSCADSPSQHTERKRLIGELPSGPREILLESMAKHVQEGAPFLREEKVAWRLFSDINCCNVQPLPAELQYSAEQAEDDSGGSAPLNAMFVYLHFVVVAQTEHMLFNFQA